MKESQEKRIEVWADWQGLSQMMLIGTLYAATIRGKEVFSFEYSESWLQNQSGSTPLLLDPRLQFFSGRQYTTDQQMNFGIFLDSSPDRWGRVLMKRREAFQARVEKRTERTLRESDFLLGVFDLHRMGGVRFRLEGQTEFLDNQTKNAAPPWTSLGELEKAVFVLEDEHKSKQKELDTWLALLVAPGSSLGGARPKANVVDSEGLPWIAKFPSKHDENDTGAWEWVAHQLAKNAGIRVSPSKIEALGKRGKTFLTKRFDRVKGVKGKVERIHFASAMTLLQRQDGDNTSTGASYLELAEFIIQHGSQPEKDLEELWRRIVFSICISNTDDHLRNHGFLLRPKGWELSPAYDLNPIPGSSGLTLNISETDNSCSLELAREVAPLFRLQKKNVVRIIKDVTDSVKGWESVAKKTGIKKLEMEHMRGAFKVVKTGERERDTRLRLEFHGGGGTEFH